MRETELLQSYYFASSLPSSRQYVGRLVIEFLKRHLMVTF